MAIYFYIRETLTGCDNEMPRALTRREIEYISRLASRNLSAINQKDAKVEGGLNKPMPIGERVMRNKIKQKVRGMINALVAIEASGIFPDKKESVKSISELIEKQSFGLAISCTKMNAEEIERAVYNRLIRFRE